MYQIESIDCFISENDTIRNTNGKKQDDILLCTIPYIRDRQQLMFYTLFIRMTCFKESEIYGHYFIQFTLYFTLLNLLYIFQ